MSKSDFRVLSINNFDQNKLINEGISNDQSLILRSIFIMINNNIQKDGTERFTHIEEGGEIYYDISREAIIRSIPILNLNEMKFYRLVNPLIKKCFIVKRPIKTKFWIRLNNLEKLRNDLT